MKTEPGRWIRIAAALLVVTAGPWLLSGCLGGSTKPPVTDGLHRVPARAAGQISDDGDEESLRRAIGHSLTYLRRLPPNRPFTFGPDRVPASAMIRSMEAALELLDRHGLGPDFMNGLKREFQFYALPGPVLYTGYYEPRLEGRREPGGRFNTPLYARPSDMLQINLADFGLKGKRLTARVDGRKVLPYYTRAEIDTGVLEGKALVLAWVDPVEAFFLHIQGSGQVEFSDGETIRVGYATQNGRPYVSLGGVMIKRGLMERDGMSMQALKAYLHEHPESQAELLATNPSYIFFRVLEDGPLGCLGVPVTAGRSIAVDRRKFPDAALALIMTRQPRVGGGRTSGWQPLSRLVLLQDTGGAIKGYGRADFFFGAGPRAALAAGHMKKDGRLFILVLRDALPKK